MSKVLIAAILALATLMCSCSQGGETQPTGDFAAVVSSTAVSLSSGMVSGPLQAFTTSEGYLGSVTISVTGLPSGVTISTAFPVTIPVGTSVQFTLTAGTQGFSNFTVDFTFTSGSITHHASMNVSNVAFPTANVRTNFFGFKGQFNELPERSIIYDSAHKYLFVANQVMGSVEVISPVDGSHIASIPVPVPSSMDISADKSRIYVATLVQQIDVIDTTKLQVVTRYSVPCIGLCASSPPLLVLTNQGTAVVASPGAGLALWNPTTNVFTPIQLPPLMLEINGIIRSGDYSKVLITGALGTLALYDVASQSVVLNTDYLSGGAEFPMVPIAANPAGTVFALALAQGGSFVLFMDTHLNELGRIQTGANGIGGGVFSSDGSTLYFADEFSSRTDAFYNVPFVRAINTSPFAISTSSFQEVGVTPDFYNGGSRGTSLEDSDGAGTLFGVNGEGVTFVDITQLRAALPAPGPPTLVGPFFLTPDSGPTSGGTLITLYFPNTIHAPEIFVGNNQVTSMTTTILQSGETEITAFTPPGPPGVTNVTILFDNGWFTKLSDVFSYGPSIAAVSETAGNAAGGDSVQIHGYGFGKAPGDASVTIGGRIATVSQFSREPGDPDQLLVVTPPGTPGAADVTVTTAAGSMTEKGAFRYLKNEQVFPHGGTFKFVTYDKTRQHLYLSNSAEIDVFDLTAQQYLTPLLPPNGPLAASDMRQSALTPDGSKLLVADYGAKAVDVFTLDSPGSVVSVPVSSQGLGPLRMAITNTGKAIVQTGGAQLQLDLATLNVSPSTLPVNSNDIHGDSAGDIIYMAPNTVWNVTSNTFITPTLSAPAYDAALADDGTIFAAGGGGTGGGPEEPDLFDGSMTLINLPFEEDLYAMNPPNFTPGIALQSSGSLFYQPQEFVYDGPGTLIGGVDLIDVHNSELRERVLLSEPLLQANFPTQGSFFTIDENGARLFALTKSGLTVAELSTTPLSIGSVQPSQGPAAGGTHVTIRGSGFRPGATVTFGATQVVSSVIDANTIAFDTPTVPGGGVRITLQNPDGASYFLDAAFVAN